MGTRPEIIKMSPVVRECLRQKADFFILHTGQHYSYEMDAVFFKRLGLPRPAANLGIGAGSHGAQTGRMLVAIEATLKEHAPDVVLVQGDTNSVLAGALAAAKLEIPVGHVEAGLRSFNRRMPEEINRIIADHVSNYLFAPTKKNRGQLLKEGIQSSWIHVTGNTVVDAVRQNLALAHEQSTVLEDLAVHRQKYVVATIHRQENVDSKSVFRRILRGLVAIGKEMDLSIIYPAHPRSKKMLGTLGISPRGVRVIDALDYFDFLALQAGAALIATDSGGVQEEAAILKVPCITLREETERTETVELGANIVTGSDPAEIVRAARRQLKTKPSWRQPFGDGRAAERIVNVVCS